MAPRPAGRDDVVAAVARIAGDGDVATRWVGIDGCGGAGKSTLAAAVAAGRANVVVVHIDDFAAPGIPEWDWSRFRSQVVIPLLAGRPARYQRWGWDRDQGAEWHDIEPGRVVVVDGVSSTRREVGVPWTLTVWVDAPRDVRLARARERDGEAMVPQWVDVWMPEEDAYVARERPQERVDLIASGTGG